MLVEVAYADVSVATAANGELRLRLFPNLRRAPTHLRGTLSDPLIFRDALLSLHDIARSELFVSSADIERRAADPVVTVSRSAVYFEAFSRDESTYGRITLRPDAFSDVSDRAPGCTNVDFSQRLRTGLSQIRTRTQTTLVVEPHGIELQTGTRVHREEKIDLPDGWVHGFLSVQSALRSPAVRMTLHPGDLRNLLVYMRARKETVSPRSLRFRLDPGQSPRVLIEPWNEEMVMMQSRHTATASQEVRVWGRRRLLLLQAGLPSAQAVRVLLQGSGLPSFWSLDFGVLSLTLGMSPWCERDWTADTLDLQGGVPEVDEEDADRVLATLTARGPAPAVEIADATALDESAAVRVLDALCARGRVLYDPETEFFVARRLFDGAPPPPPAPAARRKAAVGICARGGVKVQARDAGADKTQTLRATVTGNGTYAVIAILNEAGVAVRGVCACPFFARFGFQRGACKHLLAVAETARGEQIAVRPRP